jgi:branched-chain amino acid transport system permease protein
MDKLVELVVSGVSLGAIYALLALGFVVVFKATEVVNFAHPGLLMVGAYFTSRFRTVNEWPFLLALAGGIAVAVFVALIVERVLVRPLAGRTVIGVAIMTIGVDILLQTEINRRIGIDVLSLGDPWQSETIDIAGVTIPTARVAGIVVAVTLMIGFFLWFKWSDWGVAVRAAAEDREAAALMGIRLGRVAATTWAVAGVLATVAGLFLTAFPAPGLDPTTSFVALRAFPAAILGGLDSTGGALVGGLLIGLAETLGQGYQEELGFLGRGFHTVMPYVVMVVVLLIRPTGLFGNKEATRV